MQRKTSKNRNGRGPNVHEKNFQAWLKHQNCYWCQASGPSIVDHCRGATFGHKKIHIGHWFCIPQCVNCDTNKTINGKRQGNESKAWVNLFDDYNLSTINRLPHDIQDIIDSIRDFDK